MNSVIAIENVSFGYTQTEVLHDISLTVLPGQVTGILGPNGSGKSTLLRLITGEEKPARGSIRVLGKAVSDYGAKELARTMALVPQSTHIDFDLTALDVALMGRQPYISRLARESAEDVAIARKALADTDTLRYEDTPVTSLSGGEMQRVVIARALAQETPVLLLDEPVSSLDIRHSADILSLAKKLAENGKAVVCVLHDLNMAGCFCDRIALLREGTLVTCGTARETLTKENILQVYGLPCEIFPSDGAVRVLPIF